MEKLVIKLQNSIVLRISFVVVTAFNIAIKLKNNAYKIADKTCVHLQRTSGFESFTAEAIFIFSILGEELQDIGGKACEEDRASLLWNCNSKWHVVVSRT